MGWVVFAGIVLIGIGAFLFLKPDLMWKLTELWKSYRADGPSDFYLKSTKFGGVLFMLCGIVAIVLLLVSGS